MWDNVTVLSPVEKDRRSSLVGRAPDNAEARAGRGIVYARYGQSDKAVEYFKKALALDPNIDEDKTLSNYISTNETK